MTDPVRLEQVTFTYPDGGRPVLDDVTLTVHEGTFALIVGHTGSGKSTLLRTMNGLVPHFSGGSFRGRTFVGGRDTVEHPPRKLADVVAFVPQNPAATFVVDRVEDELAYAMENLGVPPDVMRRRVEEALDLLDLAHLRDRSVREISGGERQRVAIAAALTAGPRILLLDEPTSQLDPQGAEDVLAALQRLVHDLGMTVIAAEHRLERVAGFADSVIACTGDGRVIHGDPGEALVRVGIGPPVAHLGRMLAWDPVPLNVRDARRAAKTYGVQLPLPSERALPVPGDVLLAASQLSAGYDRGDVVRDVSLELRAGEIVALMGRNGAGKTTLLRSLAGLHVPRSGAVSGSHGPPCPGSEIALCPQDPESLLFKDTVRDEVLTTVKATESRVDVDEVLQQLGIGELSDRHPRDLSSGQRLLVAVGAVVATGARVLLLDEPTRGLDNASKELLVAFLRSHSRDGGACVVATHDVELVGSLAERVLMMAQGELIADGDPRSLLGDSSVFAPQTARVFGSEWLTPADVAAALDRQAAGHL